MTSFFAMDSRFGVCRKGEAQKAVASGRAFVQSSFKLKVLLVASLVIVAGLFVLLVMKEASGASTNAAVSKELEMKEALKHKQAIKDAPEQRRVMWEFVKKGNTLAALKSSRGKPGLQMRVKRKFSESSSLMRIPVCLLEAL